MGRFYVDINEGDHAQEFAFKCALDDNQQTDVVVFVDKDLIRINRESPHSVTQGMAFCVDDFENLVQAIQKAVDTQNWM